MCMSLVEKYLLFMHRTFPTNQRIFSDLCCVSHGVYCMGNVNCTLFVPHDYFFEWNKLTLIATFRIMEALLWKIQFIQILHYL